MFVQGLSPGTNLSDLINYVEIVTKKDVVEDKVIQNYTKTAAVVMLKGKPGKYITNSKDMQFCLQKHIYIVCTRIQCLINFFGSVGKVIYLFTVFP